MNENNNANAEYRTVEKTVTTQSTEKFNKIQQLKNIELPVKTNVGVLQQIRLPRQTDLDDMKKGYDNDAFSFFKIDDEWNKVKIHYNRFAESYKVEVEKGFGKRTKTLQYCITSTYKGQVKVRNDFNLADSLQKIDQIGEKTARSATVNTAVEMFVKRGRVGEALIDANYTQQINLKNVVDEYESERELVNKEIRRPDED